MVIWHGLRWDDAQFPLLRNFSIIKVFSHLSMPFLWTWQDKWTSSMQLHSWKKEGKATRSKLRQFNQLHFLFFLLSDAHMQHFQRVAKRCILEIIQIWPYYAFFLFFFSNSKSLLTIINSQSIQPRYKDNIISIHRSCMLLFLCILLRIFTNFTAEYSPLVSW